MTPEPRYNVGTWDSKLEAYTPQDGLTIESINIPLWQVRKVLKELQAMGYTCHRIWDEDGYCESDLSVYVELVSANPVVVTEWKQLLKMKRKANRRSRAKEKTLKE